VKKVLIITYYWPPSGGAGVQRWLKFAKYLPEYGVEPYVLTVDPNYATYPQTDNTLEQEIPADLKIFKTRSFEVLGIISGVFGKNNIPYGGFSNVDKRSILQTILRFIRGNFFIPDARRGWNKYVLIKGAEIIRKYDINTIITTGPPHSTHLAGLKLKKKLDVKWIADFRDPWTDIYYYPDMLHTGVAKKIDRKNEKNVLEGADVVIANCNSNLRLLISKVDGAEIKKFTVLTNGFDPADFDFTLPPALEFIITYSGTMSDQYKPQVFFRAFTRLIKKNPDIKFKFRLAGNISSSAERQIMEYGFSSNFEYPGYVSHSRLAGFLKSSSALLYIFPEAPSDKGVAGKLFEYLAVCRPIIAIGPTDSDASAFIEECEAGKSFTREDESGILEYLDHLVGIFREQGEVMAGNGMHLNYSRKKLTSSLSSIIKNLS
jgi:glycosyltransferase involved in cell wall biosynthesis